MGAQPSLQQKQIDCPRFFKCWNEGKEEVSPYKDRMEQKFFYEIDVRDLLQSNKDKDKERRSNILVSAFKTDLYSHSNMKKQKTAPNTQAASMETNELNAETCRKQLFAGVVISQEVDYNDVVEGTIKRQMKEALKENQNISNFSVDNKKISERKQSNRNMYTASRPKRYESPQTKSPLSSLESQMPMLKQISKPRLSDSPFGCFDSQIPMLKQISKPRQQGSPFIPQDSQIPMLKQISRQPPSLPQMTKIPQSLVDQQNPILRQISRQPSQPKTPISQSWEQFLQSTDKGHFLCSNQNRQKRLSTPHHQKSNQLINYLRSNFIGNTDGAITDGYGEIRYQNGDMLCGFFQNNLCEGKGKYIKKDGSMYEGDFVHSLACGKGVYIGSDGYRYEGGWKDNLPSGHGKAIYSDVQSYQGQFFNGKRHGKGTLIQNGCKYIGQFKNDQIEGNAQFISENGQTYNGEWKENAKEGFGEYRWPNGDKYIGNYRKGRREGYGVMYYQNGDTFSGNWRNGMKNGQGIYSSTTTGTLSGSWVRSKYVGNGSFE